MTGSVKTRLVVAAGAMLVSLAHCAPLAAQDDTAPPPPAPPPAAAVEAYPRAFFDRFYPQTALELLERVPGFSLDTGAELRGFAGAAGNVLVDGERPTIKAGGLEDFLSRIPADAIDRIEVTRGAQRAGETAGQGLIANVIRKPQSFAGTAEVIAVVSAAKPFGGVYDTHQRDESSYGIGLLASVEETIRIGCESGLTANVGHIKALGVDVWGQAQAVLDIMARARARGCVVTADQYPWTASGTGLSAALLPRWAQAGGRDSLAARAADAPTRARILAEMRDNLRRRGGDSTLLMVGGGVNAARRVP